MQYYTYTSKIPVDYKWIYGFNREQQRNYFIHGRSERFITKLSQHLHVSYNTSAKNLLAVGIDIFHPVDNVINQSTRVTEEPRKNEIPRIIKVLNINVSSGLNVKGFVKNASLVVWILPTLYKPK